MKTRRECRHNEGAHHSCEYVNARDRLIPAALLEAERAGHAFEGPAREQAIARAFFAAMDRMAEEHGLTDGATPEVDPLPEEHLVLTAKWGQA